MDTLQLYAPHIGLNNLHIPMQRSSADDAPLAQTRAECCPVWCRGHGSGPIRSHVAHTIEARVAGDNFPSRWLQVSIHAEHKTDGTPGDPWVTCATTR